MNFADRMQLLKPSATLTISAKATELKTKGKDILNLSLGEPDMPIAEHVLDAVANAGRRGIAKYTPVPGTPELRDAVGCYYDRIYETSVPREATMSSNGGKQCIFNACQALLNPGDEVLLPCPYWLSYPDIILLAGGVTVPVPTTPEQGFKVTVSDLERFYTPKTKMLFLNSPSNPTGACYSREELEALALWAIERDVIVMSDELYDQLYCHDNGPVSLIKLWEKHPEHVIVINGLSKNFSMPGWRVGYTVGHPDLIKQMNKLQGQVTSNICSLVQEAAIAALTGPYDSVFTARKIYNHRRDVALDIIKKWPAIPHYTPEGAFYIFLDVSALFTPDIPDSTSMCAHILDAAEVALVPGVAFGDDRSVRLSYSIEEEKLVAALHKLAPILGKKPS
jgi:aspartate aminotransferase